MESNAAWKVRFSGLAVEQLTEIFQYLLDSGDADYAGELVGLIRSEGRARLAALPFRGRVVPELLEVTRRYREIRVQSYRLIYRVIPERQSVIILLVAHVKQDIRETLVRYIVE